MQVRLEEVTRLVIETCIATGARISEVLGLQWKHLNLDAATIKIEQRVWHQEVARPKTEDSRRTLGVGDLVTKLRERAVKIGAKPDMWVFPQKWSADRPMWDSTVRELLHEAAKAEDCDILGLGPHSFRRVNITWRQEVGGSAIEASRIAGHANLETTSQYTFVAPERQNELTRRIQQRLAEAAKKPEEKHATPEVPPPVAPPPPPQAPLSLVDEVPFTGLVR